MKRKHEPKPPSVNNHDARVAQFRSSAAHKARQEIAKRSADLAAKAADEAAKVTEESPACP